MAHAHCPVVVVPEPEHVTQEPAYYVVGVDGSEHSGAAVDVAFEEAALRGAELRTLYVWEPGHLRIFDEYESQQEARRLLSEIVAGRRPRYPEVDLRHELVVGHPVQVLTDASAHALGLVVGTRGRGGFTGMLLGSVSQRLAAYAHCPLVVVHGEQPGEPRPEVVLGLDHDTDPAPIDFAFDTAAKLGLSVRAVRAYGPVDTQAGVLIADVNTGRREAEFALDGQLGPARERYPHVPVSLEAESGNPVAVLLAAGRDAHLIVIGARRHHRHLSLRPGYTVHGLLSRSQTPVAVVPTP
jgi:nucleotide-binding universal stress UspA family protein